jgi:small subunit ribosomal protein S1
VSGHITGRTKGGLMVDVGVEAFMPGSQVDVRPVYNLDSLVGQHIPVRILKLNRRRGNVVVSRKAALETEVTDRKSALLESVAEGSIVQGIVKNLTDYGAFIDLGGIDGLLHVSDMSYGRVTHPSELVQVGQELSLRVMKFDKDKERISLGLKQMAPDPWESVHDRYQIGMKVIGRVVSITDYGSFVELEPGVEGLIHISEMTWSRRMKHPSKVVKVGDTVESVILDIKPRDRRVSLGIKQLEDDPWTTVESRYAIGSVVEGRVRKLSEFGAFIEIEEGIDGLVHVSDLSWTKHIKHPSEVLKKGQVVQAVILNIDAPLVAGRKAVAAGPMGIVFCLTYNGRYRSRQSLPVGDVWCVCRSGARSGSTLPFIGNRRHDRQGKAGPSSRRRIRIQDHSIECHGEEDRVEL